MNKSEFNKLETGDKLEWRGQVFTIAAVYKNFIRCHLDEPGTHMVEFSNGQNLKENDKIIADFWLLDETYELP